MDRRNSVRKTRVFQFPIGNSNGGITHYAMNNWRHMDKSRFECDLGAVANRILFEDEIFSIGAGIRYASCYAEDNEQQFMDDIRNILTDGKYDVVHLHTSIWKSFLVEQVAVECKIPKIIVHSHTTRIEIPDEAKRIETEKRHNLIKSQFNTSLATDFWACSKDAADWLFGEQIPREQIKIMKNAIDVDSFIYNSVARDKCRKELGLEDCFVIGHVGRVDYAKNHEFLLDIFADVEKRVPNARLLIIGDGPLKKDVEAKAETLGISDKVVFTGHRNDVDYLMQAMDTFCLPSRFEGFGTVIIEALSSGLKCIASDVLPEEIHISDDIRFLPFDVNKWSDMIVDFSGGYDRKNMHDFITEAGYNIKYQIKEVEKLYLE